MVWAQSPGMDGIVSPSSIPLGLVLFDIWIQVSVLADLIQDVIDTPVVYLILCCMFGDRLCTLLVVQLFLVWG